MYRSPGDIRSQLDDSDEPPVPESPGGASPMPVIHYLMGVVIQTQDQRKATEALEELGAIVIALASTGAFLARRNVTLLVAVPPSKERAAVAAIQANCHERIEYVATPVEGTTLPMPLATPITVGGATIFRLPVERFETF